MSRIQPIDPNAATGRAQELLQAVHSKMGVIPNMVRTMAHSASVVEGYVALSAALGKASLNLKTREAIALAVGQANKCQYCVSAHTLLAGKAGVNEKEITAARTGESADPKLAATLRLALAINNKHGHLADADLSAARSAGLGDAEILEVIGVVSLNIFTNYVNDVAKTEIDFPVVSL